MIEELCERCYHLKDPRQMATLYICEMQIRACIPCVGRIVGVIGRTPLAKRAERLREMKAIWQTRAERRAS